MNIKNYLWIIPFLSFALGYIIMQRMFRTPDSITPHLVGKHVHEILPLITQHKLNIRLMDQKEEADIPEGIILNQTPQAGTLIRPNQQLFIVTTKKPTVAKAPHCVGVTIDQLTQQLSTTNISPRIYYLPHPYPEKMCFAQSPQAQEFLEKNRLILYISSGNNKPIIWPDFTDLPLNDVIEFLNNYSIQPQIINDAPYKEHINAEYRIKDQRPFAGTLLTLDEKKPLSVQLRIS
jgi:beta-lactam-binding protein with PASTA domain